MILIRSRLLSFTLVLLTNIFASEAHGDSICFLYKNREGSYNWKHFNGVKIITDQKDNDDKKPFEKRIFTLEYTYRDNERSIQVHGSRINYIEYNDNYDLGKNQKRFRGLVDDQTTPYDKLNISPENEIKYDDQHPKYMYPSISSRENSPLVCTIISIKNDPQDEAIIKYSVRCQN